MEESPYSHSGIRAAAVQAFRPPEEPVSRWVRASQLFLVPLAIVVVCAGIYLLATWMAFSHRTIPELIAELRASGGHARAHLALQLASELRTARDKGQALPGELVADIGKVLKEADPQTEDGAQTRQFLALCLGVTGDARGMPILEEAIESDSNPETKAACIDALGAIGDPLAARTLRPLLDHSSPIVRRYAVFNLASVSRRPKAGEEPFLPDMVPAIRGKLEDSAVDVRWNAACGLALFLRDDAGRELLHDMLDRKYVEERIGGESGHAATHRLFGNQSCRECMLGSLSGHVIRMAIASLWTLEDRGVLETLQKLSTTDPDFEVRKTAADAARELAKKS